MSTENSSTWWIIHKRNADAAVRLVCFAYAGGTAAVFRTWHQTMPAEVEICGIQLPGRANRLAEQPFTDLRELVDCLAPALIRLQDRPVVFFGHSLGAVICFEVARWLRSQTLALPQLLIVSGRRAPQIPYGAPFLHQLRDAEFLASISKLNGIPREVLCNEDVLRLTLPALRADIEMSEMYHYQQEEPLTCPITALAGSADAEEPVNYVNEWRRQTETAFSLRVMAGHHFFVQTNPERFFGIMRTEMCRILTSVAPGLGNA